MIEKIEMIKKIENEKIIAVIRAESKEQGLKIVQAVVNGGINIIEVTMTVPGAVNIINELAEKYKNDTSVLIGAGTVLDAETARNCILAGAKFIVSPSFNEDTIKMCNRYEIMVIPGAMTIKEALLGLESGADIIKVFPGSAFGPSIIKAFKGPVPQGNFMPTGGVNLDNIKDWLNAGAVAVGTGGSLTKGAKTGNYELVTKTAQKFVAEVKNYSQNN